MLSTTLGTVFVVSGLLEIGIPLALGFYVTRRFGTNWKTWFVGALMFIVSLIRVPLNTYASQLVLSIPIGPLTYSLLIIIPSLTAGIFEEAARYVGFRYLIKDDSYEKGLTYARARRCFPRHNLRQYLPLRPTSPLWACTSGSWQ